MREITLEEAREAAVKCEETMEDGSVCINLHFARILCQFVGMLGEFLEADGLEEEMEILDKAASFI